MSADTESSLYSRLGGHDAVVAVPDALLQRSWLILSLVGFGRIEGKMESVGKSNC